MSFTAEVLAAGRGHAVVVPPEVVATLTSRRVPVLAVVGGVEHRSRLAVHAGRSHLGLPAALLRRLGVRAGDRVEVTLTEVVEVPPGPEAGGPQADVPEPAELTALLAAEPAVRSRWDGLAPDQRQEYHRWLAGTADPAVRRSRLERLAHRLRATG